MEEGLENHIGTWKNLVHPEDRGITLKLIRNLLEGQGDKFEGEFRMRHKDGSYRNILSRAFLVHDDQGHPVRLVGTHVDITERKLIEAKLRVSEEFVRNILDNVDQGFLVIDRDFRIIAANKAYCVWSNADRDGVIGRHCYEVSHKTLRPCYEEGEECALKSVFETGEPHTAMHKHQDADGNTLYVETKAFPLKDSSGIVTSAIETIHDITERRLLEAEQLKTQKLEAIGTLAGGVAHDFNNLLQGVFGYMTMAKVTLDDKQVALTMLDQAEEALNMTISLTKQLLTFSKGGRPVTKSISVRAVIENSVRFALSGSRSYSRIEIGKDLWPVQADEGQVAQVIQNIVLNANEAMPEGGTVEISARNVELAEAGSALLPKGGRFVRISIKDSGSGIAESNIQKIFDPYFTTKEKGTGLGLATSYSIVKNHGGMIEVASEPNGGSVFSIYLPAGEEREGKELPIPSASETRKGKILVMDDEDLIRYVVKEMVRSLGHIAETAVTGEEAVDKFTRARNEGKPFDIVILDLTVRGGMGGEQTVKLLREIDPSVKAVVSSGYSEDPAVSDFGSYGFSAFLSKPYMIDVLRETLNTLLS